MQHPSRTTASAPATTSPPEPHRPDTSPASAGPSASPAPAAPAALPAVVVGRIDGATADGAPRVAWGSRPARRARAVWMPAAPDWEACRGLPAALAFEDGDERRPVVVGLLAAPPARRPRVVELEAEEELTLRCGKARVALRADGRVVVQGGYVVSRSTGPNKLKGGSVEIN